MIRDESCEVLLMYDSQYRYVFSLGKMYERSGKVTGIRFNYYDDDDKSFLAKREFLNIPGKMIIEEMIHLCLPAPDDSLLHTPIDGDDGLWKECLISLLVDYQNKHMRPVE